MDAIPSSMIAAIGASAAAGKNPWLPLAMIFLLAAPDSVPGVMMSPALHGQLHALGPEPLLWSLGAVFGLLAVADSLADKIGFIEKWLVPVSTAWRPFAGIACAAIVGVAAARDTMVEEVVPQLATADAGLLMGGSIVALTITVATVFTWIATMGKTGARLVLTMIPVPGLKLAHSLVDDFFAFGATIAGFAFGDSTLVIALLAAYLAVGVFTGPILTRLTWIHVKIGIALLRKARRAATDEESPPAPRPAWLRRWLASNGLTESTALEAYAYRSPGLGLCRAGFLVLADGHAAFVSRVAFRPRAYRIAPEDLARVGLGDTATVRTVTLVERTEHGGLRQVYIHLFPGLDREVLGALDAGARAAGCVRVRAESESARATLPGFADRGRSVRFIDAADAGALRLQGLLTIAGAIIGGVLSGGVFVPIGTGYLASPFKQRFVFGWLISGYLALCVIGSFGMGWPAAVLYASVLNAVTLRDLTRHALKAHIEGFVDRREWLPVVAGRVWVPLANVLDPSDRLGADAPDALTDGSWRAIAKMLVDAEESPAPV